MSRLIKPTLYAKEHNISRQAVYAKIKKGLLPSKTVDGKIYILLPEENPATQQPPAPSTPQEERPPEVAALLSSKDETIAILKENIQDLKATNQEINSTLRGEIELLKQVFTEMRSLYVKQLQYMNPTADITRETPLIEPEETPAACWVDLETFLTRANIKKKRKRAKIEKRLLKAYQRGDRRIIIKEEMLFVSCYDFYEDILK